MCVPRRAAWGLQSLRPLRRATSSTAAGRAPFSPLLQPPLQVPSIQQTAALALGRLANYSDDLAEAVVANDILPQLVYSLGEQNVRGVGAAQLL